MKRTFLMLLALVPLMAIAQKKQKDTAKVVLPIVNGSIVYETIIDTLKSNKTELYDASLKWLANTFVDSKEVIQIKDAEKGNIVGSGTLNYTAPGFIGGDERLSFMVDIAARDNKVRLRLYQIRYMMFGSAGYKTPSSKDSDYYPIEKSYFTYLAEKRFPLEKKKYYALIDSKIRQIVSSYVQFIKGTSKPDEF
jgi:hypothetical protein